MKAAVFFLVFCFNTNVWATDKKEASQETEGKVKKEETSNQNTETTTETKEVIQKQVDKVKERFQESAITLNLGMNMTRIKEFDDSGFGLMIGGKYSYYFSPKVGAFIGIDYMQRNASEEGKIPGKTETLNAKLNFIDIPFGLTFKYRNILSADGATFLGLYYTLSHGGKLKIKSKSLDTEGEDHLGFLLHSETYFEVNENFNLGFFAGLKFGFGNAITEIKSSEGRMDFNKDTNTLDVMFGVVAKF